MANNSRDRLTQPLIRKNGKLQPASWDEAMNLIVRRSKEIQAKYGSAAIGFYTTGQLFLEEYYTLGVIGKAIEPPGEARSDFDIFVDYARRMDFRDKNGAPLIKWQTPEQAFEAWKECSRGRPCDYSGLSYAKLTGKSGIQIPCNAENPEGTPRLYTNGVFNTSADYCQTYGHNVQTGQMISPFEYRSKDPKGKALLKAADYQPPSEVPDAQYPLWLTTGRVVYHWHTRTKTGRSKELNSAAPDAFVQISQEDAKRYGISQGDMV